MPLEPKLPFDIDQALIAVRQAVRQAAERYGGDLPADVEVLTSFPGVGPKCAHLALGISAGQHRISVDIHVHRVTNRWGYVQARSPERTMEALEERPSTAAPWSGRTGAPAPAARPGWPRTGWR